jgi:hypothetical protein
MQTDKIKYTALGVMKSIPSSHATIRFLQGSDYISIITVLAICMKDILRLKKYTQ